jgi:hypothetical protein
LADTFAAQVADWVKTSQRALDAVARESAKRLIEDIKTPVGAGGRMPVDTGFLRASGQASTSAMPMIRRGGPAGGASFMDNASEIALVIAGWNPGDPLFFGFIAEYAAHVEYGANGRLPAGFVRGGVQKWQAIVDGVVRDLAARRA